MSNTDAVFVYVGALMVMLGVAGYVNERRKRGAAGVRRFLLWYTFVIPFMACGLCAAVYPRLHWLWWVPGAMAVAYPLAVVLHDRRTRGGS